jgi:UDP-glucose 4-epimerase
MKILITGSNSFVGSNFRKFSRFKDVDEVSLIENKPEDLDLRKYDVILHVAAIVHQTKKIHESEYFYVNRDLCVQTAEYAKKGGAKQFVFLSTLKVYGEHETGLGLRNEHSKCFPDDSYGRSKYEAENGLTKLNDVNFTVSIIRPSLVYGKGVKANMQSIVNLIRYCPLLPFRNTNNRRDFIYVENLISLIDRIIEEKVPGVFIAKDAKAISTMELVQLLSNALHKKVILFKLPKVFIRIGVFLAPGIINRLYGSFEFDNTETRKKLNFNPPYTTAEGIEKWISIT